MYSLGDGNDYLYDDLDFDYDKFFSAQAAVMAPDEAGGSLYSPMEMDYGPDDLWLEVPSDGLAVSNQFGPDSANDHNAFI